jgi:hydroxymethylglutaryl-CoA reductase (NADPH)
MMTRNAFALNDEFGRRFVAETGCRPLRVLVEANMGGDKKPSAQYFVAGGHGKTVLAEVSVGEETLRRVLRTSSRDLVALEPASSCPWPLSGAADRVVRASA